MKKYKYLVGFLLLVLVFFIYLTTLDKKIYYLNIGDSFSLGYQKYVENYLKEQKIYENSISFLKDDIRVNDLIYMIESNEKKDHVSIKNALIKADCVTLSIGFFDFASRVEEAHYPIQYEKLESYMDELLIDFDSLFQLLRESCKEPILVLGYYNPSFSTEKKEYYELLNERLKKLCEQYHMTFVNIYELLEENKEEFLLKEEPFVLSNKGYSAISREIISKLEQILLK